MKLSSLFLILFVFCFSKIESKTETISASMIEQTVAEQSLNQSSTKSTTESNKNVKSTTNDPNKPCPEKCTCSNAKVTCLKAGLTEMLSINEIPKNTKIIDLSFNQFKRLSTLDHLPELTKLILRHNHLSEIIEPEVFEKMPNLKELDLSFNENLTLSKNVLRPLENLETLKLTACNIEHFDENFFEKNRHLTKLYVNSNPLIVLNETFFKHFRDLEYLDLTNTKLVILDIRRDDYLNNLKVLNLSDNLLESVPLFKYAPNIETLILDNNRLQVLNKESFMHLKNLIVLEISNNPELIDIEELTFSEQTKLKRLVISNNNHLFLISQHAFYGLYNTTSFSLEELILNKNSLHFITEELLKSHWSQLKTLDLRMNPWNCNCHLAFLHKYKNIKSVNEIRCKEPDNLVGIYLVDVDPKNMKCVKLIDSLLYEKLKNLFQIFLFLLAFLVFALSFLLLYVTQDRSYSWSRMFGTGASSTIYYQKANTKECPILM